MPQCPCTEPEAVCRLRRLQRGIVRLLFPAQLAQVGRGLCLVLCRQSVLLRVSRL